MEKLVKSITEALLFSSDKPLSAGEIHACLPDKNLSDIIQALKELQIEYDKMGRGFVLKEVAQGYQFRTQPEYAPYVLRMLKKSPARLSRAAMESLAIIAYKQPILRQEIERLRGVDVGGILRMLMQKGLIRIMGRKNLPGRPLVYGTTRKFLETFDLNDLESLPKLKEIKGFGSDEYETPSGQEDGQPSDTSRKENDPEGTRQALQ